jgi:hypothetical protein
MHIHIVMIDIHAGDMFSGAEAPVIVGRAVGAKGDADIDARADRSPAIVAVIFPPGDPCRRPFITRIPYPARGIIIEPLAIVEGSPSPTIIGDPGPALIGIDPMATGSVGPEVAAGGWHPHISVVWIIHPGSKGRQLIIENLKADRRLCVSLHLPKRRKYASQYRHAKKKDNQFLFVCFHFACFNSCAQVAACNSGPGAG